MDSVKQVQAVRNTPNTTTSAAQQRRIKDDKLVLEEGTKILEGRYRVMQLLYQRPRLNLYLGRRLSPGTNKNEERAPLVAIRELVLTGIDPSLRAQIEAAAFEEFVTPAVLGSPRLPTAGDRVRIEGDRHYLIMQLSGTQEQQYGVPVTLDELLLSQQEWPHWVNEKTVLNWGIQLCRMAARLHRQGVVLGEVDPATVLVDREGKASWMPLLLVSWPPAPHFWDAYPAGASAARLYAEVFPLAATSPGNAFAAPERLEGRYDVLSDVYSLGAILYLLLTRYAPVSALHRLYAVQEDIQGTPHGRPANDARSHVVPEDRQHNEGLELAVPSRLNIQVSAELEQVVLRALALDPPQRYSSMFEFVEALEAVEEHATDVRLV